MLLIIEHDIIAFQKIELYMSTRTSLLGDPRPDGYGSINYAIIRDQKAQQREIARSLKKDLSPLECNICWRRTCIKTIACVCTPLNCLYFLTCADGTGCCSMEDYYRDIASKKTISPTTTCSCYFWQSASPPESSCDLCKLTLDPFVMCCCCSEETFEHYLLPPERQRMTTLQERVLDFYVDSFPAPLQDMIRSYIPEDRFPPNAREHIFPTRYSTTTDRPLPGVSGGWF